MLVLFSIVIVFSNTFMLYFSVSRYSGKLQENNIHYSEQVLGNLIGNLEEYIKEVENITDLAIYNYYIQDYLISLNRKKPEESVPANYQNAQMGIGLLGNVISTRSDISSIFIFNKDGIALYKTSPIDINTKFDYKSQDWYKKAVENPDDIFVTGPHQQIYAKRPTSPVFSISRTISSYDGSGMLGVILVDTNLNIIQSYANSAKLTNDGFIFIVDDKGEMVYHPSNLSSLSTEQVESYRDLYSNIIPRLSEAHTGYFNADIKNEKYQIVYKAMNKASWYVVAASPYKSITNDANKIRDLIILVGFICLVLVTLISVLFSNRITKPIAQLTKSMDKADHGNLDIRVPVTSNDEVGMLSASFNKMLERLDGLMRQVVVDQEEKRKLELKALQHQINPHFLYNTLDSIIWLAEIKDDSIVPMTEALSKLFRISLSRGHEMIPLKDELEHVRNYLFIQSMRYLNKFDYKIEVPENLLECKTIKLILQPLVENSIYHGIKNKTTKGNILIRAYKKINCLIITITDDGIGMDEETCKKILAPSADERPASGSGFGVRNVDERIKLYFGKVYGVSFESKPGEGTTAFVTLPLLRE
jgi:Predicted signal transduction protein with a C-terminal ATPase domain